MTKRSVCYARGMSPPQVCLQIKIIIMLSLFTSVVDELTVCCGNPKIVGRHMMLRVPTEAALVSFKQIQACPPQDPGKFALRLLSVFFSDEVLSTSNCTKAEGRALLDQEVLLGIKRKLKVSVFKIQISCY